MKWLPIVCLVLLLTACAAFPQVPQGQAVRSLNGSATNLTAVGGEVITDSGGLNFWELTNSSGGILTFQNSFSGPLGLINSRELASTFTSNVFFGPIFASGTPGIFASAIPGPGYMGNYTLPAAWNAIQAVNLGNPYPFNIWFAGSQNAADGTSNIVMRMGWNTTSTGNPVKTDIGTFIFEMEGNEADVDTNHTSTAVLQVGFPDGTFEDPMIINTYIRPGDPLYKTVVNQWGANFVNYFLPNQPGNTLMQFELQTNNVQINFSQTAFFQWQNNEEQKMMTVTDGTGTINVMTWEPSQHDLYLGKDTSSGQMNVEILNGNDLHVATGGILSSKGANQVRTATNQDEFWSPPITTGPTVNLGTNGTLYANSNLFIGGQLTLTQTTNTPSNTNNAKAWMVLTNKGVLFYSPLFQ